MPNSEKKKTKDNSITQRQVIQCGDYSGFFSLLSAPSLGPFTGSLAGRRRKERRGKSNELIFLFISSLPRESVQTMGSIGSSTGKENWELGVVEYYLLILIIWFLLIPK